MVNSMTGFGRGTASADGRELTVELKSVNHRYLDLSFRMPRHIGFIEDTLRQGLGDAFSRGHIDVYVNYKNTRQDARRVEIDTALLSAYVTAAHSANEVLGLEYDMTLTNALRLPDVTNITEQDEDRDAVCALAKAALDAAGEQLRSMRSAEGARLHADLFGRADTVLSLTCRIADRSPVVVEEYRVKLTERIEKMLSNTEVDRARLATEVALFADKASIDEETVRLKSHVVQMKKELDSSEPAGRKLDFIVQEMNREFNTIGSKANDSEITSLVILGKAEVEKLREQIQNIE